MKQKLFNALKPVYGKGSKLGLDDEAIDRVATLGATVEMNDEQIAAFVLAAEPLFKEQQSAADRERTKLHAIKKELEGKVADLEAKLKGNQPNPNPEPPKPEPQPQDMARIIADAVAAAIKPISDELAGFKAEQGAKAALANAEATFKDNDYVKKYADEAADAWERATEMYEATGKSWTAEQLQEKAMGYFNKAVSKKGVDTAKPFVSDGGSSESELDMAKVMEIYRKSGRVAESKPQV